MSRGPANPKRYPLEPLIEAMGMTANQACLRLGVSGSVQQKYRAEGVIDQTAELLATRAGFHPYEIWPELADDRYAALPRCAECDEPYVPRQYNQKYCSRPCGKRVRDREAKRRKYHSNEEYRARRIELARLDYEASKGSDTALRAQRIRNRRWRDRNRDRYRALQRAAWARRQEAKKAS